MIGEHGAQGTIAHLSAATVRKLGAHQVRMEELTFFSELYTECEGGDMDPKGDLKEARLVPKPKLAGHLVVDASNKVALVHSMGTIYTTDHEAPLRGQHIGFLGDRQVDGDSMQDPPLLLLDIDTIFATRQAQLIDNDKTYSSKHTKLVEVTRRPWQLCPYR